MRMQPPPCLHYRSGLGSRVHVVVQMGPRTEVARRYIAEDSINRLAPPRACQPLACLGEAAGQPASASAQRRRGRFEVGARFGH
jgi:hypothetical protein